MVSYFFFLCHIISVTYFTYCSTVFRWFIILQTSIRTCRQIERASQDRSVTKTLAPDQRDGPGTRGKTAGLFHEEMFLFLVNDKIRPIKINKMRVKARKNGSYNIMCKHRSVIKSLDGPTKHYQCDVTRCGPISF